jgi:Prokaryotic E2 family A/ThiF family/Prokaryotic homologs of the JAB domain
MSNSASEVLQFPGDSVVEPQKLKLAKARALALAVQEMPFVRLVEARRDSRRTDLEIVVLEVEVERSRRPVYDIRHRELFAIEFSDTDSEYPAVLAMRADFPHVPHLNCVPTKIPRSICLYEQPYSEIRLRWTPTRFVDVLRSWLSRTADGTLHQGNQPLEPLILVPSQHIVFPNAFLDAKHSESFLVFLQLVSSREHETFYAHFRPMRQPNALVLKLTGQPHIHGLVESVPSTIAELHKLLAPIGIDLLASLREAIRQTVDNNTFDSKEASRLVLLVDFPKLRHAGGQIESTERWAFLSTKSVRDVAVAIGILDSRFGGLGYLIDVDRNQDGATAPVVVLRPHFRLSRASASQLNGVEQSPDKFLLVGLGALGSQLYMNLLRAGYGQWTLVDSDIVLPHNLSRHALVDSIGRAKSNAMAEFSTLVIEDLNPPKSIEINVLSYPKLDNAEIEGSLHELTAVLDCSASPAVARHLANDFPGNARRCSAFLNPKGSDLVLICESSDRESRLDDLEMQYYRLVLRTRGLMKHLLAPGTRVRYSVGCRDISAVIRQEFVSLHAAVASNAFREAVSTKEPTVAIWSLDPQTFTIKRFSATLGRTFSHQLDGWTVRYDSELIQNMKSQRDLKLPSETGGILLGYFDTLRKIAYVAEILSAPKDSIEDPTFFVRGAKDLSVLLNRVSLITSEQLEYVGEWHTHPDGVGPAASPDDKKLLDTLSKAMAEDGLPELMFIISEDSAGVYLKDQTKR